ncbi:MAG: Protease Do [candidate division TM6 bacterium GW2011_GWE2_42_60]|nr:MAG: Protease Do [candidate division TM6 bacterium GW2011_GWE2_42_60]HBY06105.1 hypothetical protein [Candidatus Dependentiae bacterium]
MVKYMMKFVLGRVSLALCLLISQTSVLASAESVPFENFPVGDAVPQIGQMDWDWVHSKVRNMVVQVFVFRTEFNWVEPYKTPHQGMASGSAFFIDQAGLLMTNAHVVNAEHGIYIQIPCFGKRRFDVEVVGICPDRDLALLKVVAEDLVVIKDELGALPVLEFGDSDKIKRAEELLTLGYPLGQQSLKSTMGVVSGRQAIEGSFMIQIDAPISPGNSGGPALDKTGKVIGINTGSMDAERAQNVNYIIPSNEVRLFLKQLDQAPVCRGVRLLRKPFLGLLVSDGSEDMARFLKNPLTGGVYIPGVIPGSPLDKAGVKEGDMLYAIDGHEIDYYGEIKVDWNEERVAAIDYVSRLDPGETVHLTTYRNGAKREVSVQTVFADMLPIRIFYPEYEAIDYEVIGGMVVMELAINHMPILIKMNPRLSRYLELENQFASKLVVTHLLPNSEAVKCRVLRPGMLIDEINGRKVTTLKEFRNAVKAGQPSGYLTMRLDIESLGGILAVLPLARVLEDEPRLAATYFYRVTPFVESLSSHTRASSRPGARLLPAFAGALGGSGNGH